MLNYVSELLGCGGRHIARVGGISVRIVSQTISIHGVCAKLIPSECLIKISRDLISPREAGNVPLISAPH